jgi:DNA polymerase V
MLRKKPASSPSSAPRSAVALSFGSPAGASGVGRLDLNDILLRNPLATYLMRIVGDSMRAAGVLDGDLALVDRAVEPAHGHVVIAVVEGEFVCRRLHRRGRDVRLCAAEPGAPDWVPGDDDALQIWGVVTHVVRPLVDAA